MKVAKKFQDAGRHLTFAVSNSLAFGHDLVELGLTPEVVTEKPIVAGHDDAGHKYVMESQFT